MMQARHIESREPKKGDGSNGVANAGLMASFMSR
jgi:hypothetical protein